MTKLKRYSVDVSGNIIAVFDDLEAARSYLSSIWWNGVASIYDHEKHEIILTVVLI